MHSAASEQEPVIIKKYANRRLYDTGTSAYITLEDLYERVKDGREFIVVDAKTGQDLTRQVLTQIILEQEIKGMQMLPTNFLRSAIRFYDGKMQNVFQHYLEGSMKTFITNQERMQSMLEKTMGGLAPLNSQFNPFEEITRQNVALFEKTVQMLNPFGPMFGGKEEKQESTEAPTKAQAKQ